MSKRALMEPENGVQSTDLHTPYPTCLFRTIGGEDMSHSGFVMQSSHSRTFVHDDCLNSALTELQRARAYDHVSKIGGNCGWDFIVCTVGDSH